MTATRLAEVARRRPSRTVLPIGLAVALVAGGLFIGGPFGGVVALIGVGLWWWTGRPVAPLALALLVVTALATVLDAWPTQGSLRQSFASDRTTAAAAGLAAGVALLVALAQTGRAERATVDPPARAVPGERTDLRAVVSVWWPFGAIVVVGVALRVLFGGDPLPPGHEAVADSLRSGLGFVHEIDGELVATTIHPPLGVVLAAVFPAVDLLLAVITGLTIVGTMRLGHLLGGHRLALTSGLAAALLPWVWAQPLPEAATGLAIVTSLVVAWPPRLTGGRAAAAGVVLGLAALARPEAVVLVPIVIAWILCGTRGRVREPVIVLLAAGLTVAPWVIHLGGDALGTLTDTAPGPPLALGGVGGLVLCGAAVLLAAGELWHQRDRIRGEWATWLPFLALPVAALATTALTQHAFTAALVPSVALGAGSALARLAREQVSR